MTEGVIVKFRVDRTALSDAVSWTARTLPQRPAYPVLAGVRIVASDGQVTLSTFDYEVSATSQIAADIIEDGEVLVSGRLLSDICKSLDNKPVDVDLEGQKLSIRCGAANFSLLSMPLDSYPDLPTMPEAIGTFEAQELAHAVAQVAKAAARDEALPLLATVKIEISGDRATIVATDRYRLAVRTLTWAPAREVDTEILVKAKILADMTKSLTGAGQVTVSLATDAADARIIGMEVAGRTVTSQLTDGDYPAVARLFPPSTPIHAVVDREELIAALRRVSVVADHSTPVHLTFNEGGLQLEVGANGESQASEHLPCLFEGDEMVSAFNPQYLLDGLTAVDTTYVRMSYTHPAKPMVLTGQAEREGEDDDVLRYLLMPIRA